MTASLFAFLYRWLLEAELPVALQVLWKLLTLTMFVLIVSQVVPNVQSVGGQILLSVLAAAFLFGGLFTKLGEG